MVEHRFRDLIASPAAAAFATPMAGGFVPCPMAHAFTPPHLQFVQQVYQIAAERSRAQLVEQSRVRRRRMAAFSVN